MSNLLIGEVSRVTGVKVPTIRYYEGAGMLPVARRAENNRRIYDDKAVKRIAFIRHARNLGFSMSDIKALIALQDNPAQSCRQADAIARARLAEIELRIRHLQSLQAELQAMIGRGCRQRVSQCRVIEGLVGATG
ncbi:MerR family transcriptional regulator [Pseudorhodoplanes sinuspersici]|jgi:DNA-binding transcriptional MerR regulator|uniref:MerR family transcriptional regulator n=1 Tax=Pseudorhodoplanes sinuspersici TaxID=1235591 RepID=A0A1W6ZUL1_9HYPH|nr:helix-turn-helix domain-containing protein [Pseudorhodoplanes sinuspersici]ARQ01074.1 MerR family transcriptional regulator [Pseudorhodoplanes sinuspersici]RKE72720.1 MerR family transcriptional regulator [Pseudorhodoplanes sinuspersici]